MTTEQPAHLRRDRAESFGAVAGTYDRFRPGYPEQLVTDLVALRPTLVLDIGTGTGKAARLLSAAGLPVLGVEIDPKMADVARGHGVDVEVGSFEEWDDSGRTFDLITAAQAWHWVDPVSGAAKAARLLNPAGTLAPFWNFDSPDAATTAAVEAVYARLAPGLVDLVREGAPRPGQRPYAADLRASGHFTDVEERTYTWTRRDPVDEWVGRIGTQSDHLLLGPDLLAQVQRSIRDALLDLGPEVVLEGGTYLVLARRGA